MIREKSRRVTLTGDANFRLQLSTSHHHPPKHCCRCAASVRSAGPMKQWLYIAASEKSDQRRSSDDVRPAISRPTSRSNIIMVVSTVQPVIYGMVTLPSTLSELKGHFRYTKRLQGQHLEKFSVGYITQVVRRQ